MQYIYFDWSHSAGKGGLFDARSWRSDYSSCQSYERLSCLNTALCCVNCRMIFINSCIFMRYNGRRHVVLLLSVALCYCSTNAEDNGDVVAVDVDEVALQELKYRARFCIHGRVIRTPSPPSLQKGWITDFGWWVKHFASDTSESVFTKKTSHSGSEKSGYFEENPIWGSKIEIVLAPPHSKGWSASWAGSRKSALVGLH